MDPFNQESDEDIEALVKRAGLGHLLEKTVDDPKKDKNDKRTKEEIEY